VVLAAIAGFSAYFHNREKTDDAQVDGTSLRCVKGFYGRVRKFW